MEYRKNQDSNKNTGPGIERRFFNAEYRASPDGVKKIGGIAATYDSPTDMGWFVEIVKPGFFEGADTTETACLKNHDPNLLLGRTANNTLILNYLPTGLDYEALPPDTACGNDTYTEVKGGYIYKSSFAFTVKEAAWKMVPADTFNGILSPETISRLTYGGEIEVRELIKCGTLYDVSPVTYPAYQATSSDARADSALKEERKRFLPDTKKMEEERAKVKVELEIEISTDGEEPEEPEAPEQPEMPAIPGMMPAMPEPPEMDKKPKGKTLMRQLQENQNRLRIAQAKRMQFI